jgi:hypothetical protein
MKIKLAVLLSLVSWMIQAQSSTNASDWLTLNEKEFSVSYPKDWDLDQKGQMGTSFILFSKPSSPQDLFRENVNLLIQNLAGININLDKYVEISEEQIKTMIANSQLIESKRMSGALPFHKEIYTGDQGILKLKFEQYYWVKDEKAYVLTFTAEVNQFDTFKQTAEAILKSFKLH